MKVVAEHFGFEPDHVVKAARQQVAAVRQPSPHQVRGKL